MSEWAGGGREESPTVAAEGRRYGSHTGPNAAGRRPPEPLALRGRWGRVRHRAPQPPRRRHHATTLLLEHRGTGGPASRDAGAEKAPGELAGGGCPGRLQHRGRGAPRGSRRVGSALVVARFPQRQAGRAASCQGRIDPRLGATCAAERPGDLGPGAGGEMELLWVGTRVLASSTCPDLHARGADAWRTRRCLPPGQVTM